MTAKPPPTAKPSLVVHDETPERLVLTWQVPVLWRLLMVAFGIALIVVAPFVVPQIRPLAGKVFVSIAFAAVAGAGIAGWWSFGRIELSATELLSTRRFVITFTELECLRSDIVNLKVTLETVSSGKETSLQWQLRAQLQTVKASVRVATVATEEVGNYVREQLERRLAMVDTEHATPYR
ncbi:MAG TPA: hypothetical protein VGM90_16560 [Kofleriaceae bacterium]|jgi:hypothetical protein